MELFIKNLFFNYHPIYIYRLSEYKIGHDLSSVYITVCVHLSTTLLYFELSQACTCTFVHVQ